MEEGSKYCLRKTEKEFNELSYKDVIFYYKRHTEDRYNSQLESLTSASFTAWQILRHRGETKKSWDKYLKDMVPSLKKSNKLTKEEKIKILSDALEVDRHLKAYEKYLKKKG